MTSPFALQKCSVNEMNLLTANHSSYPRIGSTPEEQALRRAITRRDQGWGTDSGVLAAEDCLALLALQDQQNAGLDLVTDGMIRWHDPVSHLAGRLEGPRTGDLLRYFDTNFYFRRPVTNSKLARTNPLVVDEFRWAAQRSTQSVKTVLTGPLTLARLSLLEDPAANPDVLVMSYAEALSAEIGDLAAAGAGAIQIGEPWIAKHPFDFPLALQAWSLIAAYKGKAKLWLATIFGDATPLYARLQESPFDVLAFDFTYSPNLLHVIEADGSAKPLGLGLIDGRNTKLEDTSMVARQVERVMAHVASSHCYLTTSCGLEYLPRDRARQKLNHLTAIKNSFLGVQQ